VTETQTLLLKLSALGLLGGLGIWLAVKAALSAWAYGQGALRLLGDQRAHLAGMVLLTLAAITLTYTAWPTTSPEAQPALSASATPSGFALSDFGVGAFFNGLWALALLGFARYYLRDIADGGIKTGIAYAIALPLLTLAAYTLHAPPQVFPALIATNALMLFFMLGSEILLGVLFVSAAGILQMFVALGYGDRHAGGTLFTSSVLAVMAAYAWTAYSTWRLFNPRETNTAADEDNAARRPAPRMQEHRKAELPPLSVQEEDSDLPGFPAVRPRHDFSHIVGMDETKRRLLDAGRKAVAPHEGEPPRNGILLSGEPGNGKTFFAEALAGELKLPFIKLTFAQTASRYVNQTTESVRQAFEDAIRQAPCVLFIDEVDSFLADREASISSGQETSRTANTLLTLINDLRGRGVLLIAATNFADKLDAAGVREGRFDFKIEVPPPDFPARQAILTRVLGKEGRNTPVEPDVVDRAARRWEGFSVARITAIAKEATEHARQAQATVIGFDDLMAALRRLQGTLGDRLPEDTPDLSGVFLPEESSRKLAGIAYRMREIEEVESLGGTLPTGLLFYGPPGTGKTLGVRALAKETGWAFISTNGQALLSDKDELKSIVKRARDIRPVIVFIDEADDVLADRGTSPWTKSVTNDLLTAMDGAKGKVSDIVWVAATNHPDALDAATVRGGRFQEKILFDLPDEPTLTRYIEAWMRASKAKFAEDLTPGRVTALLYPTSIANARAILQSAINHMIGAGERTVLAAHIESAQEEIEPNA